MPSSVHSAESEGGSSILSPPWMGDLAEEDVSNDYWPHMGFEHIQAEARDSVGGQETGYSQSASGQHDNTDDESPRKSSIEHPVQNNSTDEQSASKDINDDDTANQNIDPQLRSHLNVTASFDSSDHANSQNNGPSHHDDIAGTVRGLYFPYPSPEPQHSSFEQSRKVQTGGDYPELVASGTSGSDLVLFSRAATHAGASSHLNSIGTNVAVPNAAKQEGYGGAHDPGYTDGYAMHNDSAASIDANGGPSSASAPGPHSDNRKNESLTVSSASDSLPPIGSILRPYVLDDNAQYNIALAPQSYFQLNNYHQLGARPQPNSQVLPTGTGSVFNPDFSGTLVPQGLTSVPYEHTIAPYGTFAGYSSNYSYWYAAPPGPGVPYTASNVNNAPASNAQRKLLPHTDHQGTEAQGRPRIVEVSEDDSSGAKGMTRYGSNGIILDYLKDQQHVDSALGKKLKYSNLDSALAAFTHRPPPTYVPPYDPSKPKTPEEQCAYVLMMMDAAFDMSLAEDNQGIRQAWETSREPHQQKIELAMWRVLELLLGYHSRPGFLGCRPRRRNRFIGDKYSSFAEHVEKICDIFRRQKTSCRVLLHEENIITIVDDPDKYQDRTRNNRRINRAKKTVATENRELAEASREASQAKAPEALDRLLKLASEAPKVVPSRRRKRIKASDDEGEDKPPASKRKRGAKATVQGEFLTEPEPRMDKPKSKVAKQPPRDEAEEPETPAVKSSLSSEKAPAADEAVPAKTIVLVTGKSQGKQPVNDDA